MSEDKMKWMIRGDCTEACTSPPVCPYYWGSSTTTDLHDGINQCEGAFSFRNKEGYYDDVNLDGLNAGFGFNSPVGVQHRSPGNLFNISMPERMKSRQRHWKTNSRHAGRGWEKYCKSRKLQYLSSKSRPEALPVPVTDIKSNSGILQNGSRPSNVYELTRTLHKRYDGRQDLRR